MAVLARAAQDAWLREGSVLIFTRNPASTERLRALLDERWQSGCEPGISCAPLVLHENMDDASRRCALQELREAHLNGGAPKLLIATGMAARGLDVASLRHVVLYDMPDDVAGYVHSAGRTARKGNGGLVSCLVESQAQAQRYRELHALTSAPRLTFAKSDDDGARADEEAEAGAGLSRELKAFLRI